MPWTIYEPTWQDKQTYGQQVTLEEMVDLCAAAPVGGGVGWPQAGFVSVMKAENDLLEWSRPMVWRPDDMRVHLTTDRGVCALNSYWWGHVSDAVAFDPQKATEHVLGWLWREAEKGTQGSSPGDWRPLLDWQWHAYGTDRQKANMPDVRAAFDARRASLGLAPL